MTDVRWRMITKAEFVSTGLLLNEIYKMVKQGSQGNADDKDTITYYENTGKEWMTQERIFLYRTMPWVDEEAEYYVNEAVVTI